MTRPGKTTSSRATRRRQGTAANLMGLGLLFILAPLLFGSTPLGAALRPLGSAGWLLLVAGGMLLWLRREKSAPSSRGVAAEPPVRAMSAMPAVQPAPASSLPKLADLARSLPTPRSTAASSARARPATWGPDAFQAIEWRRFEALVEALFAQAGFETKSLSHGVDIWLYSKNQPDGQPVSVVQCKRWKGRAVGVDKVRELRGVMAARNVQRGQFATTS